jgi:hypothetical protein
MEMDCMTEEKNEGTYEDFYCRRILLPSKQQKSRRVSGGCWLLVISFLKLNALLIDFKSKILIFSVIEINNIAHYAIYCSAFQFCYVICYPRFMISNDIDKCAKRISPQAWGFGGEAPIKKIIIIIHSTQHMQALHRKHSNLVYSLMLD